MELADVLEVARGALWTVLLVSAPIMGISLGVGLLISLFQALTQIQEMTLAFIPKIIAVFISALVFLPYMSTTLRDFTVELFDRMAGG